jgi:hypothetical protein
MPGAARLLTSVALSNNMSVASSGTMGVVVVKESSTGNPTMEALAVEAATFGEEAEIEEIIHPEEEKVAP